MSTLVSELNEAPLPTVTAASRPAARTTHDRYRKHRFSRDIQEQIRALNELDNWHAPIAYARDVAIIAASVWMCLAVSWWLYPVALILIGSRMRAFSNLLHESAHGMVAKNRKLSLLLGTVLTAYPILQLHYAYKKTHVATHHPRLGDIERDPDLAYMIEQRVYEPADERMLWLRLAILPALGSQALSHVWFLLKDRLTRREDKATAGKDGELSDYWQVRLRRDRLAAIAFWAVVISLAALTGNLVNLVLFWVVPFLTTFQILGWYIELSEHTPLVRISNVDLHMTRNRKSRGLELFLTGTYADHYHLDHHLDPRTPYWNLHKAHRIRMADPEYAAVDATFGGLFNRGAEGQPSAIAQIIRSLASQPMTASVAHGLTAAGGTTQR